MTANRNWIEITYGSRWPSTPSPECYQIYEMICAHCDFKLEPQRFRLYDAARPEHPQPYGNFASISHARKLMREHVKTHREAGELASIPISARCSGCGAEFMATPWQAKYKTRKCAECKAETRRKIDREYRASGRAKVYPCSALALQHRAEYYARRKADPQRKKEHVERHRRWVKDNPEKIRAHRIVTNAIHRHRLVSQPCENCGADRTHAHHDDYSKPLEIRWLCAACHRRHHAALAAAEKGNA